MLEANPEFPGAIRRRTIHCGNAKCPWMGVEPEARLRFPGNRPPASMQGCRAMRIIALINQKGGCGKTTSSINLAACLAHMGQRTLLVDMDPQGHCAVGLAVPDAQIEKSVYDILRAPGG